MLGQTTFFCLVQVIYLIFDLFKKSREGRHYKHICTFRLLMLSGISKFNLCWSSGWQTYSSDKLQLVQCTCY